MQIKITMSYHLTTVRTSNIIKKTGEKFWWDAWNREPLYTLGGGVNWPSHCGKQYSFLKKVQIELPYFPAISLLDTYVKEIKPLPWKDISSSMFAAVLFVQSCLTLCDPINCSPPGSSVHWNFSGKNTGAGCHFLLQEIFLTQGLNPYLCVSCIGR